MPFMIIRDDLTKVRADAIVNTANPHPRVGAGTDSAVYKAAGERELLAERKKIGDIPVGKAVVTSAFRLPAKYMIHTVGPVWVDGKRGETAALQSCYMESLKLARQLMCQSIAFPLISTGSYGFPKDLAIKIAASVFYDFLMEHDMTIYLVVFDRTAYDLSGRLFRDIQAYIDENYVSDQAAREYPDKIDPFHLEKPVIEERRSSAEQDRRFAGEQPQDDSLAELLSDTDITFQECLLKLILERDLKNSEVYHGANISKQHFSKILSNRDYHPTKNTACALALSLHLSLEETAALLGKAGLVLTKSSRFDLVVEYFILHGMYNVVDDNIVLDENNLELLGTQ